MHIEGIGQGKVRLEFGPISMTIAAWENGEPLDELCREACGFAGGCLAEISESLEALKKPWGETSPEKFCGLPLTMWKAVSGTGVENLTPMAAVAGTMSDTTADWLWERGANRVIVNNGGDIALRLAREETVVVGIISSLAGGRTNRTVSITGADGIGGIATSGLGGRSFTLGIADAVTALGKRCAQADACATALANMTYVSSPRVKRRKAALFDPASDIAGLDVTVSVEALTEEEIGLGFYKLGEGFEKQEALGNIVGAVCYIQGIEKSFGELFGKM